MIQKHITIECDDCCEMWYKFDMEIFTLRRARSWLHDKGWKYNRITKKDYCFDCAKKN